MQAGYFGETFGRPFPGELPFDEDDPQADLYATADESSESVMEFYRASWRHAQETFAASDLDTVGQVPWWSDPEVSLHQILVHMTNETARHAGHLDIVRETIDGAVGRSADDANIVDGYDWPAYVEKLEAMAREAGGCLGGSPAPRRLRVPEVGNHARRPPSGPGSTPELHTQ